MDGDFPNEDMFPAEEPGPPRPKFEPRFRTLRPREMSVNGAEGDVKPRKVSGIRTVLSYTGIPPSWLDKRPKLPSRNWLIFLSTVSTVAGFYIYDRQQCKKIKREYIERVKHLAEEPLGTLERPRKVTVYGAKWPGDEDYDQSLKYFRKYVKPVLVAAAVDYEMINGKRHGELARRTADEIKSRRRLAAGIDSPSPYTEALPTRLPPDEEYKQELAGGIVIVGRPAFKEFMAGLQKGWSEGLEKVDAEEDLAQELSMDGRFDEPEVPEEGIAVEATAFTPSPIVFSPLQHLNQPKPAKRSGENISSSLNTPPSTIPLLPPLLLVPFIDYIGFTQVPLMLWDFFNQRHKVRAGARAAYSLIIGETRPFDSPSAETRLFTDITTPDNEAPSSDIDFDRSAEAYYKRSTSALAGEIEKARTKFYEALPAKLATARALARGEREYTKEENERPPPSEMELRAERLKKELRWRRDLEGWEIVKPATKVAWDDRFKDILRLFVDPPSETEPTLSNDS
ncbi:hypothetical protein HGRIS_012748 [Hohenbuehelia grisea]|uniref:Mitochondrial import inner membrane translocase subunit TIM54 n=1 Tax=Hohenbuehelia grisea TaxID=104357 RepID=A0ABR3ITJ7_9AGAR